MVSVVLLYWIVVLTSIRGSLRLIFLTVTHKGGPRISRWVGGGGSMHWKGGVNTVKTLKFEKGGGAPSSSNSGAAPGYT